MAAGVGEEEAVPQAVWAAHKLHRDLMARRIHLPRTAHVSVTQLHCTHTHRGRVRQEVVSRKETEIVKFKWLVGTFSVVADTTSLVLYTLLRIWIQSTG